MTSISPVFTSLFAELTNLVEFAVTQAGYDKKYGSIAISERPDLGQFQCNGALAAAKEYGEPPRQIAEKIAAQLTQLSDLTNINIAGPGFINISITDQYLSNTLSSTLADPRLSCAPAPNPKVVILDFGGPNIAKPLHVGHLRSSIIGDCLQRLYRFAGHSTISDIHLGDWGTPYGIVIAMIQREQPDLPYFTQSDSFPTKSPVTLADLERLYPAGSILFKEDPAFKAEALQATAQLQDGNPGLRALWQHFIDISLIELKRIFDQLGVHFDWWYGESHYHDRIAPMVERLLQQGKAEYSQGAVIVHLDLKDVPPLLLVKSDGAYLYATTDLAAIEERVRQDKADSIVYETDLRQKLHFTQVFRAARLTGIAPEGVQLTHIGHGTINNTDGKAFKTRSGDTLKLQDLINLTIAKAKERMQQAGVGKDYPLEEQDQIAEKVALAALKFADLINNPASDYIFDLERFVSFEGKTGPYLIYTAVRIKSVFRRLPAQVNIQGVIKVATPIEQSLGLLLVQLPEVINRALEQHAPHFLCEYAFSLAQEFNRFYQQGSILHEEDAQKQNSKASLANLCLQELTLVLDLLGIQVPNRM